MNLIIEKWIDELDLIKNPIQNKLKIISLPIETLINLVDLLSQQCFLEKSISKKHFLEKSVSKKHFLEKSVSKKCFLEKSVSKKCFLEKSNSKLISKNGKNTLQIYNENIINFFIKKQLNSNWTYLKYNNNDTNYEIRWNIIIYLYQKDNKSYETVYKKKIKKKEIENTKSKKLNFNDFFDKETDEEN